MNINKLNIQQAVKISRWTFKESALIRFFKVFTEALNTPLPDVNISHLCCKS